jgi:hypothetical protein
LIDSKSVDGAAAPVPNQDVPAIVHCGCAAYAGEAPTGVGAAIGERLCYAQICGHPKGRRLRPDGRARRRVRQDV